MCVCVCVCVCVFVCSTHPLTLTPINAHTHIHTHTHIKDTQTSCISSLALSRARISISAYAYVHVSLALSLSLSLCVCLSVSFSMSVSVSGAQVVGSRGRVLHARLHYLVARSGTPDFLLPPSPKFFKAIKEKYQYILSLLPSHFRACVRVWRITASGQRTPLDRSVCVCVCVYVYIRRQIGYLKRPLPSCFSSPTVN